MFTNYLKTAWRSLLRHRGLSLINIFGFSTGLAFVLLIGLFIKNESSFDRFHANQAQLYRVTGTGTDDKGNVFSSGNSKAIVGPYYTRSIPSIAAYCRLDAGERLVKKGSEALTAKIAMVDSSFFTLFSFPLTQGDPAAVLATGDRAVVSEETAMKFFGTKEVTGSILEIELEGHFISFTISGVAKDAPYNSSIGFDIVIPFNHAAAPKTPEELTGSWVNTFVLLKDQASIPSVERSITAAYRAQSAAAQNKALISTEYKLQPLAAMHLDSEFSVTNGLEHGSNRTYSVVLAAIALLILVIACINFINILLARSMQRAKEIGIRKIAGSTRKQLVFQFLTESVLITVLSILPAALIIGLILPYFSSFVKMEIHPLAILDFPVILAGILLIVATGLLAGAYPAFLLSSFKPIRALSGKLKLSGRNLLGRGLIVFQFILAVFLIISSLTMQNQLRLLSSMDLGYATDRVLQVDVPRSSHKQTLPVLQDELKKLPGTIQTTVTNWGNNRTKFTVDGHTTDWSYYQLVDDRFLDFFGVKLLEGRNFYPAEAPGNNCMVNQAFVRAMGWKDAIGRQIGYKEKILTVTGVIADYHNASLKEEVKPIVLMKRDSTNYGQLYLRYSGGTSQVVAASVQQIFKKIDLWHTIDIRTLDDVNARSYQQEKNWMAVINFSACVCILLCCLGLFGLSTLTITQRVKEIGIRKVLGATVTGIVLLVSKEFLRLVLIASVIAFPVSWWAMKNWLQDFAYRTPIHWWLFAVAAVFAVLTALAAISFQTLKAARTNPATSLRTE